MKSKHIVFVPGLFGWAPGELGDFPYWGEALTQLEPPFTTHWLKCGPISSFHDRACEIFAQIKGTRIDYGADHSTDAEHARFSRDFTGRGVAPDWSKDNPIVLVGHSAGAQTCLQLQQLLARDFWGVGSNEDWVEAIVSMTGVLNGTTLAYITCDEQTGQLRKGADALVQTALDFIAALRLAALPIRDIGKDYDLFLDQWIGREHPTTEELLAFFAANHRFVQGEDNLAFDLGLQGCLEANRKLRTGASTYYFSFVGRATHRRGLLFFGPRVERPDPSISFLLRGPAEYQALRPDFAEPPIKGWGSGDLAIDKWRENDGAVSTISQRFPFTAGMQPVGGNGILGRDSGKIEKGKWYVEDLETVTGRRFDHFDPVVGAKLKGPAMEAAQLKVYAALDALFRRI